MKKHLAAVFAATAVLGVTTAFAANPFSDVTPQDWAYQAVAQLASEGVVNGYPDGTFKGQNNITRYEMAQMVAKAMARQDRVNAEQQALINRLADEFSAELNNLGVRVSTLENKVGTFKFTGDARLRYRGWDNDRKAVTNASNNSKFDYRARITFTNTVNDNTKFVTRLSSDNREFGDSTDQNTAKIDRVYAEHKLGKYFAVSAGRMGYFLGQGLIKDDTVDGVKVAFGKDNFNGAVTYGYVMDQKGTRDSKVESVTYELNAKLGKQVTLSPYFIDNHNNAKDVIGGSADINLNRVWVGGEYAESRSTDDSAAWVAGVGFGNYAISKPGTWDIKGQYFSVEKNAPVDSTTYNHFSKSLVKADGYKGWMATVDYAVAKNVGLTAQATIDSKTKDKKADLGEFYLASLNYKF